MYLSAVHSQATGESTGRVLEDDSSLIQEAALSETSSHPRQIQTMTCVLSTFTTAWNIVALANEYSLK